MKEVSKALDEVSCEYNYPVCLNSRIASFYERAGLVITNSGDEGSVTIVGTVSPFAGDFVEPVTQACLKSSQVFLALDENLVEKRRYPAVNLDESFSLFEERFGCLMNEDEEGKRFIEDIKKAKTILNKEKELLDLVEMVGLEKMSEDELLTLKTAKLLRENFLQQEELVCCGLDEVKNMLREIVK